jgi:shikimate dehydrogenase
MMEKDKFAVFGNPIKQSKSPIIHTLFAQQYAQHIEYRAVRVELDDFVQATSRFF